MDVVILSDFANPSFMKYLYRYLGPYKVAHSLRKAGFTAQVIDFIMSMDEETLYHYLKKFITNDTVMLGVSTTFLCQKIHKHSDGVSRRTPEHIIKTLGRIKKEFPKMKVVLGGYMAEHIADYGVVNCRIEGAAEDIVVELVRYFKTNKDEPKYKFVKPLWGVKLQKIYNEPLVKKYIIEEDDFRFSKQDCIIPGETLPLEISRGCIFKCKFCQYENIGRGKFDYLRSMELVREELIYNYENFGVTNYNILCDTFNDSEYKMNLWHKTVTSLPFKIKFSAYLRADLLHRHTDVPHQLKETGVFGAYHGIESFHPVSSRVIGKGWSGKQAKEFLPKLYHDIWDSKVAQHLNFIVGLPNDTVESMDYTADWFIQNNLHSITFDPLTLLQVSYRNQSEFEKNAESYGYTFNDRQWVNGDWDRPMAVEKSNQLNALLYPHNKVSSWVALSALSVGMPEEQILVTRKEFKNSIFPKLREQYILKYLQKLENL